MEGRELVRERAMNESLDAHDGLVEVVVHGQLEALEGKEIKCRGFAFHLVFYVQTPIVTVIVMFSCFDIHYRNTFLHQDLESYAILQVQLTRQINQ